MIILFVVSLVLIVIFVVSDIFARKAKMDYLKARAKLDGDLKYIVLDYLTRNTSK